MWLQAQRVRMWRAAARAVTVRPFVCGNQWQPVSRRVLSRHAAQAVKLTANTSTFIPMTRETHDEEKTNIPCTRVLFSCLCCLVAHDCVWTCRHLNPYNQPVMSELLALHLFHQELINSLYSFNQESAVRLECWGDWPRDEVNLMSHARTSVSTERPSGFRCL